MAIINFTTSPSKGAAVDVELHKSQLYSLPEISGDAFWSNSNAVKQVQAIYESTSGNQVKILNFDAQVANPTTPLSFSLKSKDTFQLKSIILKDFDDGELVLSRATLSASVGVTAMDIDMSGGGPTISVVLSSSANAGVYNSFTVTATFDSAVTFTSSSQINVINGTPDNPYEVAPLTYEFLVYPDYPLSDGAQISISIPQNSVVEGNLASNVLGRLYYSQVQVTLTYDEINLGNPVSITYPNTPSFTVTATFSRPVTGFTLADIHVENIPLYNYGGEVSNLSGSGTTYTFDFDPTGPYVPNSPSIYLRQIMLYVSPNSVQDANGVDNSTSNYITGNYYGQATLEVSKTGGSGVVTAYKNQSPNLEFLGVAPGTYNYIYNDTATVIATPDYGNYFETYSGVITGVDPTASFTMNNNYSISGAFAENFNNAHKISGTIQGSVKQSDGKIILFGTFTKYEGKDCGNIVRLNSDGTADTTFDVGVGFDASVLSVAVDSSGNIWCGGNFTSYKGTANNANRIAKLNSSGVLQKVNAADTNSATGNGFSAYVDTIAIDSSGNIWCGGNFTSYKGTANNANRIAKLNSSGVLQLINSGDTNTATGNGVNNIVRKITFDSSGNIWFCGAFTSYKGTANNANRIAKLDSSGVLQLINSGDTNTATGNGFNADTYEVVLDSSGNIWVGGTFSSYKGTANNANRIAKLNSSGVLQLINSGDTNTATGNGFNGTVNQILPINSNYIYAVGGFTSYKGTTNNANYAAKLNLGVLEKFDSTDTNNSGTNGFNAAVNSVMLDSSYNVWFGGSFASYCYKTVTIYLGGVCVLAPDNPSGITNTYTLNTNLLQITKKSAYKYWGGSKAYSKIQNDGKIIFYGTFVLIDNSDVVHKNIIRFNANDTIDTGFAVGSGFNAAVESLGIDSSGNVWVGGSFTSYKGTANNANYIAKLDSSGNLLKINAADVNTASGNGLNNTVYSIVFDSSGNIWIGGTFTAYKGTANNANRILKLNSSGVLQLINSGDTNSSTGNGFNNIVYAIKFDSSGNIWCAGQFNSYKGTANNANFIAKLNSSGVLQLINSGDTNSSTGNGFNNYATSIAIDSSGNIWCGGNFTNYKGTANNANRIAKLNSSGVLQLINSGDTNTTLGNGFNNRVDVITIDSSGNIWIGGAFTNYRGANNSCNQIAKLNSSGVLLQINTSDTSSTATGNGISSGGSTVTSIETNASGEVFVGWSYAAVPVVNIGAITAYIAPAIAKLYNVAGYSSTKL